MKRLGESVLTACLTIQDAPSPDDADVVLSALIDALGMTRASGRKLCFYPNNAGAGGNGFTLFQPITESFIVVDTWPDHSGWYLHICSCRPFDMGRVLSVLGDFRYEVMDYHSKEMCLVRELAVA